MNLDRSLLFCYLEEDNIQRAYFRVRPLLTATGDIRAEADKLWPNDGCLRIVPDRNEQHTFKGRMRTLGAFCVVDLTKQPADAGKIRTNKNFRPDRGENNQYILYSDTVHELPLHTFYQLLTGKADDYVQLCEQAITPRFYLLDGDTMYGPVIKSAPEKPVPASEAAGTLFEIPCPDGVTRQIFCVEEADTKEADAPADAQAKAESAPAPEKPAEVEKPAEAPAAAVAPVPEKKAAEDESELPIATPLKILDQRKTHDETIRMLDKPVSSDANLLKPREYHSTYQAPAANKEQNDALSGTPLIRTPVRTSTPQPKNKVQEVVVSQIVGKYEPPTMNLPSGTTMHAVSNPVEHACQALRSAWQASDARSQLTDFFLSLDSVHVQLEPRLCPNGSITIMQRVLRDKLQDLEAERLSALCELDKARRDVDAYKAQLISESAARIRRETGSLQEDKAAIENRIGQLKKEINALTVQRDALAEKVNALQTNMMPEAVARLMAEAQMTMPMNGLPLRLSPIAGESADKEELIGRMMEICAVSGAAIDRNTAIAALVLLALSPRVGLSCPTPAPLATLVRNIAGALGWSGSFAHQIAPEQKPVIGFRPVDATPAVLLTSLSNYAPLDGVHKLLLSRNVMNLIRNAAYDASQWPILALPALPFVPEINTVDAKPVSAASLGQLLENSAATNEEILKVMQPVLCAASPLSGSARSLMLRFVSICCGLMEGGLPVAVDWAISLWILPGVDRSSRAYGAVKALLDEYPLSLSKL